MSEDAQDEPLLTGVSVLDLGQGIAGPYCAAMLQQQGARVIKVEPPNGDWARKMGLQREGFSAVVLGYNAGKQGLCVDASTSAGQEVLRRIAAQCDVVLQNFRAGVAERLRLGYQDIRARHPAVVYLSISGFGADGPWAHLPATDSVMQAAAGLMHANRDVAGQPRRIGLYLADIVTAIYGAQMVGAALFRRERTGHGRHLQLSLLEACCALQAGNIADAAFAQGSTAAVSAAAPSGVFPVRDGHLSLVALDDAMFVRLCGALDMAHCATDPRFATNASRLLHREMLNERVAARLADRSLAEVQRDLVAADVLAAPVQNYQQLVASAQVLHAQLFGAVAQPGLPRVPLARTPGAPTPASPLTAPRIGEHSIEVLDSMGFADEEIESLLAQRVVVQATARHATGS